MDVFDADLASGPVPVGLEHVGRGQSALVAGHDVALGLRLGVGGEVMAEVADDGGGDGDRAPAGLALG